MFFLFYKENLKTTKTKTKNIYISILTWTNSCVFFNKNDDAAVGDAAAADRQRELNCDLYMKNKYQE